MLLLDSQVALWTVTGSRRLGRNARALIESTSAVHVSAATIWELQIKAMLGKVRVPDNLRESLTAQGFSELPITGVHAESIRHFPELARHDPFDRLLVAQAQCAGMDLLTADRVLIAQSLDFIVDARV
jgi:PIN domain nuclease of toxin-antitoxin system